MNKSDSELMECSLLKSGFRVSNDPHSADIHIFNTCSVREHAEDRAISHIKSIRDTVRIKGGVIVVAGCMAQRIGKELIDKEIADLAVGPYQSPRVGEILNIFLKERAKCLYTSLEYEDFESRINHVLDYSKDVPTWHKWIAITHGCNNFCSYCIVPYVRGPLISFPSDSIIENIKSLVTIGIKEISLLGQNVNQFGMDTGDIPFHKLLERAARIVGLARINFLTSHPKDFNEDIISVIRDYKNISRSIHLPLQSGSNRILKLMNRGYSMEDYLDIVERIDGELDNYSISTDFIVGFPGETEDDFEATLRAVDIVRFDEAFTYVYSPRKDTPAYSIKETLSRAMKLDRLNTLIAKQREISCERLSERLNCIEEMIVERLSKRSEYEVMGKTSFNHPVVIPGSAEDVGRVIKIRVSSLRGATLYGERLA